MVGLAAPKGRCDLGGADEKLGSNEVLINRFAVEWDVSGN